METIKKYGGYLLAGIIFCLSLAAVIFSRKEKPQPDADTYKGDRLEDKVQIAPIQEAHEHIIETLKPVPKTESKDMASAIDAWNKAGD